MSIGGPHEVLPSHGPCREVIPCTVQRVDKPAEGALPAPEREGDVARAEQPQRVDLNTSP